MFDNLQGLPITKREQRKITGCMNLEYTFKQIVRKNPKIRSKYNRSFLIPSIAVLLLDFVLLINFLKSGFYFEIVSVTFFLVMFSLPIIMIYWTVNEKPTLLGILLDDIDRYNRVVKELTEKVNILNQLQEAGNKVPVNEDYLRKVIKALYQMRVELIRALKTEMIFKKNPSFKKDDFFVDLTPLIDLQQSQQVEEYAIFVNEALAIGLNLREEIQQIHNFSN